MFLTLRERIYGEKMKYGGNPYVGESMQMKMCHRMVSS